MWKEVDMAYYKIVTRHWPEETVENCKALSQDSQCTDQDTNRNFQNATENRYPLSLLRFYRCKVVFSF
jgi:hypothetical protein